MPRAGPLFWAKKTHVVVELKLELFHPAERVHDTVEHGCHGGWVAAVWGLRKAGGEGSRWRPISRRVTGRATTTRKRAPRLPFRLFAPGGRLSIRAKTCQAPYGTIASFCASCRPIVFGSGARETWGAVLKRATPHVAAFPRGASLPLKITSTRVCLHPAVRSGSIEARVDRNPQRVVFTGNRATEKQRDACVVHFFFFSFVHARATHTPLHPPPRHGRAHTAPPLTGPGRGGPHPPAWTAHASPPRPPIAGAPSAASPRAPALARLVCRAREPPPAGRLRAGVAVGCQTLTSASFFLRLRPPRTSGVPAPPHTLSPPHQPCSGGSPPSPPAPWTPSWIGTPSPWPTCWTRTTWFKKRARSTAGSSTFWRGRARCRSWWATLWMRRQRVSGRE